VLHSQPSPTLLLQSNQPLVHVPMPHDVPEQPPVACAGAQAVSQPSVTLPLQLKKPLVQLSAQVPAVQVPLTALQQVAPQICEPGFCVYVHEPPGVGQLPGLA
jgi:hypothetical protein